MLVNDLNTIPVSYLSHDQDVEKRVILKNGDVPNITQFAQAILQPGQVVTRHKHSDMNEVFLVQSGSAEMEVDGRVFEIRRGMVVTVQPGEFHSIINNNPKEELVLLYFGVLQNAE